jgi:hypothetical protein
MVSPVHSTSTLFWVSTSTREKYGVHLGAFDGAFVADNARSVFALEHVVRSIKSDATKALNTILFKEAEIAQIDIMTVRSFFRSYLVCTHLS